MNIKVANKYHGAVGVNIMRGSPLGNPFPLTEYSREDSIAKYEVWLRDQCRKETEAYDMLMGLVAHVKAGKPLVLVCCCKPKACHGDVIKRAIEKYIEYDM